MVYPTIPLESTSRSSLDVPIHQVSSSSATQSILLPQQQHHHLFYPTFTSNQTTNFQQSSSSSSLLDLRRHPVSNVVAPSTLRNHEYRGLQKNSKWQTKSRPPPPPAPPAPPRTVKEHVAMQSIQQQQQQHQYTPHAPLVIYDSAHLAGPHQQVFLAQPSYNQSVVPWALTEQPYAQFNPSSSSFSCYYKPPDISTFCLIPERQNPPAQYSHQPYQQHQQHSYYNVKSRFQLSTLTSYPTSNHLAINESPQKILAPSDNRQNSNDTFFDNSTKIDGKKMKDVKYIKSPVIDDKLIDESSNFNFTIEAEKMVSELCNTSSYEDEKIEAASSLKISSQEVKAEANETSAAKTQYTNSIRKSIHWACNAAEDILKNSNSNNRKNTLFNLSTATKIALAKSSTCLPLYSGDKIFSQDLINAMLRISNGWLILDHYLNKQHPGVDEKCDKDLINSFKNWEAIMPDLIDNLVKTFVKVGSSSFGSENSVSSSVLIPGDVSLYMKSGIFGNLPTTITQQPPPPQQQIIKNSPSLMRNSHYPVVQNHEQKYHWSSSSTSSSSVSRESKLKSKWTITENTKTSTDFSLPFSNLISPSPITCSNNNLREKHPMTLLSQIETKRTETDETAVEESKTINLSAWFDSMKSKQPNLQQSWWSSSTGAHETGALKSSVELGLKMDVNRQLRTLKNMRTIQSAPWTANYILDDRNINNSKGQSGDFGYYSDDLRGYMKPGSYNVPKKKYQGNRPSRKNDSLSETQSLCLPADDDESTQTIVNYFNTDGSNNDNNKRGEKSDVAWKAACASAEILLDSMSIKETNSDENKGEKINEKEEEKEEENYFTPQWKCKDFKKSSCEGSNCDEEQGVGEEEELSIIEGNKKSHVKTDSWLIKTLNNASHGNKKNEKNINNDKSICIETSQTISVMTIDVIGKATYSETVRRLPSKSKIISPIEKARDESYHSIGSFSSLDESKVGMKNNDSPVASSSIITGEIKANEKGNKSKKGKSHHQPGEKGWSVWYSSRRKQNINSSTLGPIAVEKLTSIHKTLWKMDSSRLFKYPSSNSKSTQSTSCPRVTIEQYRKIIKNPMFLDTIGYKLKNHVYRKVEHVIKDFRKIVYNSKIYHKNDKDSIEKIEALSRKLEQLLSQYFSDKNDTSEGNDKSSQTIKVAVTSTPSTTTDVVYSEEKNSSSSSCRRVSRPSL